MIKSLASISDFKPRDSPFFCDNFLSLEPIGFNISQNPFGQNNDFSFYPTCGGGMETSSAHLSISFVDSDPSKLMIYRYPSCYLIVTPAESQFC